MNVLNMFISNWQNIFYGAFWLCVVVTIIAFVHEGGHYIIARLCKVKIEAFAIGMGKEIIGFNDKRGTRWKICALPIGGYVQMFGQSDKPTSKSMRNATEEEQKYSFEYKNPWQKIAIAFAGPLANIILAFLILIIMYNTFGKTIVEPIISSIKPNSIAEKIDLHVNDVIISIKGNEINDFYELRRYIAFHGCKDELKLTVLRNNQHIVKKILQDENDKSSCVLGITAEKVYTRKYNFINSIAEAAINTGKITHDVAYGTWQLITGQRSLRELSGPMKIGQVSHHAAKNGIPSFMSVLILISVGVGVMNLLPIPVLDGGHILMSIVQLIIRRDVPVKLQYIIQNMGFIIVASLMATGFINDIISFFQK